MTVLLHECVHLSAIEQDRDDHRDRLLRPFSDTARDLPVKILPVDIPTARAGAQAEETGSLTRQCLGGMPKAAKTPKAEKHPYDRNSNAVVDGRYTSNKRAETRKDAFNDGAKDSNGDIIGCGECGIGFSTKLKLASHMDSHKRELAKAAQSRAGPAVAERSSSRLAAGESSNMQQMASPKAPQVRKPNF